MAKATPTNASELKKMLQQKHSAGRRQVCPVEKYKIAFIEHIPFFSFSSSQPSTKASTKTIEAIQSSIERFRTIINSITVPSCQTEFSIRQLPSSVLFSSIILNCPPEASFPRERSSSKNHQSKNPSSVILSAFIVNRPSEASSRQKPSSSKKTSTTTSLLKEGEVNKS